MAWTSDSTGRWAKGWIGWQGFSKFFSQLVSWTFPGEETGGIAATFGTEGNPIRRHAQTVPADASPRDPYPPRAPLPAAVRPPRPFVVADTPARRTPASRAAWPYRTDPW